MKKKVIITLFIIIAIIVLTPRTVKANNTTEFYSENITFTGRYLTDEEAGYGSGLNFGLYTPSTASKNQAIPLIVWLHGDGEKVVGGDSFMKRGFPEILNNWSLEGFNAYILCPHLKGSNSIWDNSNIKDKLKTLIDSFVKEYNVDTSNIVIAGASRGGIGAMYMAANLPEYFSKCAVMCGYEGGSNYTKITIPTRGWVGKNSTLDSAYSFMNGKFKKTFGEDNVFVLDTDHGGVPKKAFNLDEDNNGRSDVIEWMFGDYTSHYKDIFDPNITFTGEAHEQTDVMPYVLYTPSTAKEGGDIPLIVWLHGSGMQTSKMNIKDFFNLSWWDFPKVIDNWSSEGFNAYILCPQSRSDWNKEIEAQKLKALLDKIIKEYNIDTDYIMLMGFSMGGRGALYMAHQLPEYFRKLVVLSCLYDPGVDISEITIPTRGYVGGLENIAGRYMNNKFAPVFGKEKLITVSGGHDQVPKKTFDLDEDGNNRSDVIEWLFSDYAVNIDEEDYFIDDDDVDGGDLVEPIAQFLCFIPDAVINLLQDMLVSPEGIKEENGEYSIKYSPAIIFSGGVPAFDVNFINPGESRPKQTKETQLLGMDADPNVCIDESLLQIINQLGYKNEESTEEGTVGSSFEEALSKIKNYLDNQKNWNANKEYDDIEINGDTYVLYCNPIAETARWQWHFENQNSMDMDNPEGWVSEAYCEYNGSICNQNDIYDSIKLYIEDKYGNGSSETGESSGYNEFKEEIRTKLQEEIADVEYGKSKEVTLQNGEKTVTVYLSRGGIQVNNKDVYHINVIRLNDNGEYSSSAAILQSIVATWYNALRRIALVGLLAVLVYIGIRIVLTSTSAKDKAKYKSMLKDWLVAMCILFTLHYIMSITITVVENINEVLKTSTIEANGEDIMMTSLRNEIANGKTWGRVIVQVVLYCILAVYTMIFTIQYFRRTIYIAFLTMIAPLITLTYPLDKIKDNKSQAFDMWIKDYIFFMLLQVVHLLIYYILVGSSIDLAEKGNWVFAIVAIGFLVPAEKIIKKMFGFDKSKTVGALAAGATGALVMNAINKIARKRWLKKRRSIKWGRKRWSKQCKNCTKYCNK